MTTDSSQSSATTARVRPSRSDTVTILNTTNAKLVFDMGGTIPPFEVPPATKEVRLGRRTYEPIRHLRIDGYKLGVPEVVPNYDATEDLVPARKPGQIIVVYPEVLAAMQTIDPSRVGPDGDLRTNPNLKHRSFKGEVLIRQLSALP